MSDQYLWQLGDITNPGTMASTIQFTDGTPVFLPAYIGDKSTGETVTNSPASTTIDNKITAMIVFDVLTNITDYYCTYGSAGSVSGGLTQNNILAAEYFDGSSWTALTGDSSTAIGSGGSGFTSYKSFHGTCNVNATRLRFYLQGAFTFTPPNVVTTGVSDARYAGVPVPVDVPLTCSVIIDTTGRSAPSTGSRKTLTLSYIAQLIVQSGLQWQKDCSATFSKITKTCSVSFSKVAKTCSATFSKITKNNKGD